MKRITIFLILTLMGLSLFADGDKSARINGLNYNPDPSSGNVVSALNLYIGTGTIKNSNLGFNIGADYEIPVINENLTLGPGVGLGIGRYSTPYYSGFGVYSSGTTQIGFYGGVVAHYYVDWLIPNIPDQFDVFITSSAGFGLVTYSEYYSNDTYFDYGNAIGGRWNFSDNMSLYAQVGHGSATLLFGLSFKL